MAAQPTENSSEYMSCAAYIELKLTGHHTCNIIYEAKMS